MPRFTVMSVVLMGACALASCGGAGSDTPTTPTTPTTSGPGFVQFSLGNAPATIAGARLRFVGPGIGVPVALGNTRLIGHSQAGDTVSVILSQFFLGGPFLELPVQDRRATVSWTVEEVSSGRADGYRMLPSAGVALVRSTRN